jgi:hypothetical protein
MFDASLRKAPTTIVLSWIARAKKLKRSPALVSLPVSFCCCVQSGWCCARKRRQHRRCCLCRGRRRRRRPLCCRSRQRKPRTCRRPSRCREIVRQSPMSLKNLAYLGLAPARRRPRCRHDGYTGAECVGRGILQRVLTELWCRRN